MKKIIFILSLIAIPSLVSAASLTITPSSQSVTTGSNFTVNINLDTTGAQIDGVDLRYLNYDRNLLQVIQVTPGSLMPMTLANSNDASNGKITFSQVSSGGNKYSGSGTLATVTFRPLSQGNASVYLNFSPNSTTDTNVASNGTDVLTSVTGATISISGSSVPSSGGGGGGGGGGGSSTGSTGSSGVGGGTTVTPSIFGVLNRNLYYGLKGDDVTTLQKFLVSRGYTTADNITGFYGNITQLSVQKFQKAENIVSSGGPLSTGYGTVGPTTRARINSYLATSGSGTGTASIESLKAQILILQQQVAALLAKLQALQAAGR